MGFGGLSDKIGLLTHNAGVLTLQPSLLTIGGQQYRTPLLTANLSGLNVLQLYMVFVVMTGPSSFQLVVSGNFNSAGPTGYTKWKLVDAFYANSVNTVGSFLKSLHGIPETEMFSYPATVNVDTGSVTNAILSGLIMRRSDQMKVIWKIDWSGAPGTFGVMNIPIPGGYLMKRTPANLEVPVGEFQRNGPSQAMPGRVIDVGIDGIVRPRRWVVNGANLSSGGADDINSSNFSLISGDRIIAHFEIPITGWSNTPIANL